MTVTRRICGQTFETPEARDDAVRIEHPGCRPAAPAPSYQDDLRALIARARADAPSPAPDDGGLDAPPSVREAIRLSETLLPAPPARALSDAAPRLRTVALPVIALAITGLVLGAPLESRRGPRAPAPGGEAAPAATLVIETVTRPRSSEASGAPARSTDPIVEVPPPSPPASPPHTPIAARARPSARPPAPPAAPPEPPSLMEAITDAVRAGRSPADHR